MCGYRVLNPLDVSHTVRTIFASIRACNFNHSDQGLIDFALLWTATCVETIESIRDLTRFPLTFQQEEPSFIFLSCSCFHADGFGIFWKTNCGIMCQKVFTRKYSSIWVCFCITSDLYSWITSLFFLMRLNSTLESWIWPVIMALNSMAILRAQIRKTICMIILSIHCTNFAVQCQAIVLPFHGIIVAVNYIERNIAHYIE